MTKRALTDLTIRKLIPIEKGRYDVWDARVPGLGIRVFKGGIKSFFLSYRINGKRRRDTLGRYPEISLAGARQLAYERRALIASGEDPVIEARSNEMTFRHIMDEFIQLHIERKLKPNTATCYKSALQSRFLPVWSEKKITDIERKHIVEVLDKMVADGQGGAANYSYSVISKFFSWCVSRDFIETNPCTGVERPAPLQSRDRVLSDYETATIWPLAENIGYPFGNIVQLLILTGQRRSEVANMEWDHISWQERVWHIPATGTKNKKAHSLPLSGAALSILTDTPRVNNSKFVFPARGSATTSYSGFSKSKRRLDKLAEINAWTLHDLRRTAATGMARFEVPPHVVERILNHTSGTFGGVAGVYNRFGYLPEMRDALEKWSGHVMSLQDQK